MPIIHAIVEKIAKAINDIMFETIKIIEVDFNLFLKKLRIIQSIDNKNEDIDETFPTLTGKKRTNSPERPHELTGKMQKNA